MSRFDDYDGEEWYPNQADLWDANVRRALAGKRGKKALAEMRDALLALPEKRLIAGALCTVGGVDQRARSNDPHGWYREDLAAKVESEGEGVCAMGAYLWFKKVKAGADPQAAFEELPTLLGSDGEGDIGTAEAGRAAGLTFTLAWTLASRNDSLFEGMTPEQRYDAFMEWLNKHLSDDLAGVLHAR
jgi:hypothetical protein